MCMRDKTSSQCRIGWERRTDRIVLEHAQRLMRARPLHCAVVAGHGHGDEAHHNGTGLCCWHLVSIVPTVEV